MQVRFTGGALIVGKPGLVAARVDAYKKAMAPGTDVLELSDHQTGHAGPRKVDMMQHIILHGGDKTAAEKAGVNEDFGRLFQWTWRLLGGKAQVTSPHSDGLVQFMNVDLPVGGGIPVDQLPKDKVLATPGS